MTDGAMLGMRPAHRDFIRRFPDYEKTHHIDELRSSEYERIDRLGHVYLDWAGGGQYSAAQVQRHLDLLGRIVPGNPHSHNPAAQCSDEFVADARRAVRRYFRASEVEYEVIFTANASAAIKLVAEAYPFVAEGTLALTYDNHNSVNGIRVYARRGGSSVSYIPVNRTDLRVDDRRLRAALCSTVTRGDGSGAARSAANDGKLRALRKSAQGRCANLFAYPAQGNFSGVQHPLEWIAYAQQLGWDVLPDAAAFVSTNRLDLSCVHPDYVAVSFYKMFGYPTDIGALIARREALARLRRPWFAGGTISVASVQNEAWYRLLSDARGFEDGTLDYLGFPAVVLGLEHLTSVGIDLIHLRAACLTGWLLDEFGSLTHSNGTPLVRVFGPSDTRCRGATIALHILGADGRPYDVEDVATAAGECLISVRSGCFCNPGDGEVAHDISRDAMARCFDDDHADLTLEHCQQIIADSIGRVPNTLRVSLGLASNFADVYRFLAFVASYRDFSAN